MINGVGAVSTSRACHSLALHDHFDDAKQVRRPAGLSLAHRLRVAALAAALRHDVIDCSTGGQSPFRSAHRAATPLPAASSRHAPASASALDPSAAIALLKLSSRKRLFSSTTR